MKNILIEDNCANEQKNQHSKFWILCSLDVICWGECVLQSSEISRIYCSWPLKNSDLESLVLIQNECRTLVAQTVTSGSKTASIKPKITRLEWHLWHRNSFWNFAFCSNPPEPTRTHQNPPEPTKTHQNPPEPTKTHQNPPKPIRAHQDPSKLIKTHQWSSKNFCFPFRKWLFDNYWSKISL